MSLKGSHAPAPQVRANSLAGYNLRGNGVIDRVNNVEQARSTVTCLSELRVENCISPNFFTRRTGAHHCHMCLVPASV